LLIDYVNNHSVDVPARNEKYNEYVSKMTPKSRKWPSLLWAFLIGGLICIIGEGLYLLFDQVIFTGYDGGNIGSLVAATLIIIAAILTGFGIYDKLGTFAGGGSLVPITGFSNSITSAAMEHRKEGIIFGTCSHMFKIAGPVIVVGIALSILVGFVYWILLISGVPI